MRAKIGDGEPFTVKLTELEDGTGGYFDSSLTRKLIALPPMHNTNAKILISLPYYRHGSVVLEYTLVGLADKLKEIGLKE